MRVACTTLSHPCAAMKYRREIDGLRAIAVVPVILFHAGFSQFGGGFVGVDVFFVISGYLITSIIYDEQTRGVFTLRRFYERRARRILPALLCVMAFCIPAAWLLMLPAELKDFSKSLSAVAVFSSNILFARQAGYFDTSADLKPLLHTWSLAVEEQYYVLFPVLILAVWSLGKRKIVATLLALGCASLLLAQLHSEQLRSSSFFLLTTRGWELLIGALIALTLAPVQEPHAEKRRWILRETCSVAGLSLIAYAIVAFDASTPFPSVYALIPTIGAALIIVFADEQTVVGRLLGTRWLVAVGLISYSGYLWHQPLLAFARLYAGEGPGTSVLLALIGLTFVLAYLTWRFIERPFRNRQLVALKPFAWGVGAMSTTMITLGMLGYVQNGFADHFYARLPDDARNNFRLVSQHTGRNLYLDMPDDGKCMFWQKEIDARFANRFEQCWKKLGPAVVVLGDSHAMNIYGALYRSGPSGFLVGLAEGGCRPHADLPNCPYAAFRKFAAQHAPAIKLIIYHQAGSYLLADSEGKVNSEAIFAEKAKSRYAVSFENVRRTAAYLDSLPLPIPVVWLGPYVEPRVSFQNMRTVLNDGLKIRGHILAVFQDLDAQLRGFFALQQYRFTYLSSVDLMRLGESDLKVGDCITFRDMDHFSICGEELFGPKLSSGLNSLLAGVTSRPTASP